MNREFHFHESKFTVDKNCHTDYASTWLAIYKEEELVVHTTQLCFLYTRSTRLFDNGARVFIHQAPDPNTGVCNTVELVIDQPNPYTEQVISHDKNLFHMWMSGELTDPDGLIQGCRTYMSAHEDLSSIPSPKVLWPRVERLVDIRKEYFNISHQSYGELTWDELKTFHRLFLRMMNTNGNPTSDEERESWLTEFEQKFKDECHQTLPGNMTIPNIAFLSGVILRYVREEVDASVEERQNFINQPFEVAHRMLPDDTIVALIDTSAGPTGDGIEVVCSETRLCDVPNDFDEQLVVQIHRGGTVPAAGSPDLTFVIK